MKRFFRVLSVFTAAVLLVGLCTVFGVSAASAVEDAEQSVVLVTVNNDEQAGSGFAIGKIGENPQYIITNCHVICDNQNNVYNDITVYFSAAAKKSVSAEVVAADLSKDLCVLELPEPTAERKPATLCKSDSVSKGDEVFILGYPAYATAGKNYLTYDKNDITSTKGSISQKTRVNNSGAIGTNVYMTDALIDNGNSGGPMINENGEVIGIATWSIDSKDESGNNRTDGGYATIVDELIPILNSNSVPYTLSTEVSSSNSDEDVAADAQPQPASNNTMMIVIIAAVVVIAVVVVIIVISKNKKPAAAPAPAMNAMNVAPPMQQNRGGAVITGMKGIMANRSFNINGSIVLGRNSQKCNVCFPVDSKGISGVHCQIRQANGGYEIMDLGSSNGTFLGSGQKLTPNVPVFIPDGTYFYLGSAEQLFQIKY